MSIIPQPKKKNNREVDLALPDSKSYKAPEIKVVSNNMRLSKQTNKLEFLE